VICHPLARLDTAGCPALADRAHFAACAGAAPIEASSGAIQRHRLSRNDNRQLNSALHTVAITQTADPGPGRELSQRKRAAGKTRWRSPSSP
jgi:transposase